MTISKIIELCGGRVEVAYKLGKFHTFTVDRWIHKGVPAKYWDGICRMAKQRGTTITPAQLQAANSIVKSKMK